jgi:tetratricopeptide (TPR) repeat protein
MASVLNNIGTVYQNQGNNQVALDCFIKALDIAREINDKFGLANAYNNIGIIHERRGEWEQSLNNHLLALQIGLQIGDKLGVSLYYNSIGIVYYKQGNYKQAIENQLIAFQIAGEIANKNAVKEYTRSLFTTYQDMKDYENALKYHEKFHETERELLGEETQKQINGLNFQRNMEQKEKEAEIERLKNVELKEALEKLKIEKSRSERLFQNQLIELKSSALQARMDPHFVFNSLNSIQQYIWEKNPEEATAYLGRFSKLIRATLDNSRKQYVTLERDLAALLYYIELESLRFQNKFKHQIICGPGINTKEIQLPPMMIQPFVENAILHGLQPLKTAGRLDIILKRIDSNVLHISIEDNGVGRVKANQNKIGNNKSHQSVAMDLTRERLEKMNGASLHADAIIITDLYDENHQATGTKVEINVPVEFSS